jgi:hypothetical protein
MSNQALLGCLSRGDFGAAERVLCDMLKQTDRSEMANEVVSCCLARQPAVPLGIQALVHVVLEQDALQVYSNQGLSRDAVTADQHSLQEQCVMHWGWEAWQASLEVAQAHRDPFW